MSSIDLDRQGFLGADFDQIRATVRLAIVGVSGGGSHVAQQLAHLGFEEFVLMDPDTFGKENLHRHVGARSADVTRRELKVNIGRRVIRAVSKSARIRTVPAPWQRSPEILRQCDVIFGCVDSFKERSELESCARRYLIPYIDVGMDVFPAADGEPPRMVGQAALSAPGELCLRCLSILTDRQLALEASAYGGHHVAQQVVYANGVLASAAVGLGLDYLTAWSGAASPPVFLQYDGNLGTLTESVRLDSLAGQHCPHFPADAVGDPVGRVL